MRFSVVAHPARPLTRPWFPADHPTSPWANPTASTLRAHARTRHSRFNRANVRDGCHKTHVNGSERQGTWPCCEGTFCWKAGKRQKRSEGVLDQTVHEPISSNLRQVRYVDTFNQMSMPTCHLGSTRFVVTPMSLPRQLPEMHCHVRVSGPISALGIDHEHPRSVGLRLKERRGTRHPARSGGALLRALSTVNQNISELLASMT